MKKYNNFVILRSGTDNIYLLVPHPFVNDIHDIIQDFNEANNDIEYGFIYMDLETIVGNRKKRYVSLKVKNYKLIRSTKTVFSNLNLKKELMVLKKDFYKQLESRMNNDPTIYSVYI